MSAVETADHKVEGRPRVRLWRDVGGLLKEFWAAHPLASGGLIAVLLIGNAGLGLLVTSMGGAVDALTGTRGGAARGHSVLFWLAAYVIASALGEFYWSFKNLVRDYLRDQGAYRIQRRVLAQAAAAPLIQFDEGAFFEHLQRATSGMGERLAGVYSRLVDLGQLLVMFGSIAVALCVIQPVLVPLLVAGAVPSIWLQARVATAGYQAQRAHATRDRIRAHLQSLLTGREAAAEVRLFGTADYLLTYWRRLRTERSRDVLDAEQRQATSTTLGSVVSGVAYAAALALVAFLILRGRLSVGNYVTVGAGALSFDALLATFVSSVRALEEQSQFLGDLFDFWRAARDERATRRGGDEEMRGRGDGRPASKLGLPDAAAPRSTRSRVSSSLHGPLPSSPGRGLAVAAEGVRFAYPGAAQPVLRHVSLDIAPGERIAIVGENGAGKTTLAKVLVGLYRPNAGVVRLDGEPLTEGRAVAIRRRIAAVFQDFASFQLTLRENIGFGDLARLNDDSWLAMAAERADLGVVVAGLPQGYDTYLGRQFGDTELSGGQWQRVALARAFFRDADLLVLDEPTAALDPLAELALFERFADLVEGRTAIMISHRLGAARLADRVIVLQDGQIVEQGHHDTLVDKGGVYAALFAAQSQWYR